jgi:hypothetical protein
VRPPISNSACKRDLGRARGQEYGRATPLADLTGIAPEVALWSGMVVLTRTVSAT